MGVMLSRKITEKMQKCTFPSCINHVLFGIFFSLL